MRMRVNETVVPQGSHLIFYLIGADAIDIIGVPHKQMDMPGYFGDTEP
jgi:plasmid stabilization system protein ParE